MAPHRFVRVESTVLGSILIQVPALQRDRQATMPSAACLERLQKAVAATPSIPAHYESWLRRHPTIGEGGAEGIEKHCDEKDGKEECSAMFVYGSLRPDDTSGMPWTKAFTDGMKSEAATVAGYRLTVVDGYACAVPDEGAGSAEVVGCMLTCPGDGKMFVAKRKRGDEIEGYPDYYQRTVTQARLPGSKGATVPCYIYYKRPRADQIQEEIPSGDWLKRKKK